MGFTEKIVTYGFSLMLAILLLFLVSLIGAMVDVYIHPLAAIPIYLLGVVFAVSYFKEMVRE